MILKMINEELKRFDIFPFVILNMEYILKHQEC